MDTAESASPLSQHKTVREYAVAVGFVELFKLPRDAFYCRVTTAARIIKWIFMQLVHIIFPASYFHTRRALCNQHRPRGIWLCASSSSNTQKARRGKRVTKLNCSTCPRGLRHSRASARAESAPRQTGATVAARIPYACARARRRRKRYKMHSVKIDSIESNWCVSTNVCM
jgi:hypothetical protein